MSCKKSHLLMLVWQHCAAAVNFMSPTFYQSNRHRCTGSKAHSYSMEIFDLCSRVVRASLRKETNRNVTEKEMSLGFGVYYYFYSYMLILLHSGFSEIRFNLLVLFCFELNWVELICVNFNVFLSNKKPRVVTWGIVLLLVNKFDEKMVSSIKTFYGFA